MNGSKLGFLKITKYFSDRCESAFHASLIKNKDFHEKNQYSHKLGSNRYCSTCLHLLCHAFSSSSAGSNRSSSAECPPTRFSSSSNPNDNGLIFWKVELTTSLKRLSTRLDAINVNLGGKSEDTNTANRLSEYDQLEAIIKRLDAISVKLDSKSRTTP